MKLKQLIIVIIVCVASVISRAAQVDYFLKLTPEESSEGGQPVEVEIPILGFEWGLTNPLSIGSATGGAGAGKVQFTSLLVTKPIDATSALLFKLCATGGHLKKAVLTVVRQNKGKDGDVLLSTTFDIVFVSGYRVGGSAGQEGVPTESIEFAFGAAQFGASN